jgi:glycogen(starch) synthase
MVTERYGWATIAARTAAAYATAVRESPGFITSEAEALLAEGRPELVVPDGNLLGADA